MRSVVVVLVAAATALAVASPARAANVVVTPTCNGLTSCGGWFASNVRLLWQVNPPQAIVGGTCQASTIDTDTDVDGTDRYCTVQESDAVRVTYTATIKRDATPPMVTQVAPNRPPDNAGWYTHPVTFTVQGEDKLSGLVGCDSVGYGGPDSAGASVVATCRDVAGNVGSRSVPFSYDATPPDLSNANVATGDRVVRLSWSAGAAATVVRTPAEGGSNSVVYKGPASGFTDRRVRNGKRYRYVLTLTDEAGNAASRELSAVPQRRLLEPAKRASVSGPPLLRWTPVRDTRYYNVQLFRNGRKILSAWPKRARLQLKSEWRFHGKHWRLRPGLYRWYVWPGEGRRARHEYGRVIGHRRFTIAG